MLTLWHDARRIYNWQAYAGTMSCPLAVVRRPVFVPDVGYLPDRTRWAIFHRKTGRELVTGVESPNISEHVTLLNALLDVVPGSFWADFHAAKLGDPFVFPPEYLARALDVPRTQLACLTEIQAIKDRLEAIRAAARVPIGAMTLGKLDELRALRAVLEAVHA